jgi:Heterokaryon incompatibility protein (HET)
VIDIGQSASDLRLIESGGRHAKYAALSHCWGTSPIWTTTVNNQTLPHPSQLPGNFQDAVAVTRMLGLQYLWIDSLCILQDSADDWEVECANMANIYKNAEVTISVRDNTSSSPGGFLQDLTSHPYRSCALDDGLTISDQPVDWSRMEVPGPLGGVDKRGWILQEKLLSRRLLHFDKERMYWECCRHTCFEGLHHPVVTPFGRQRNFFAKKLALEGLKRRTRRDVYSYWYEVVHDYSERQLTKQIDKLPALSGLASVFADVLKDTYLAGLWKKDIVWGLCWRGMKSRHVRIESEDPSGGVHKHQIEWVAPSWSWASCNRPVEWPGLDPSKEIFHERLEVRSVHARSEGHDPFGVIDSASLIVVGKMKTGFCDGDDCFDAASGESLGHVYFNNRISDVSQLENATVVERETVGRGLVRFAKVSLLLVATTGFDYGAISSSGVTGVYLKDCCLLLTPKTERNTYSRVGLLWTGMYAMSAKMAARQDIKDEERWVRGGIMVQYPWFENAKEQEVILE